jgi:GR25 family glycosyltransferase involved in LPS biosynthesis
MIVLIFLVLKVMQFIQAESSVGAKCHHIASKHNEYQPEVYFINMDRSVARRKATEDQLLELGLRGHRVKGITPQELFISNDLLQTWETRWCLTDSEIPLPDHLNKSSNAFTGLNKDTRTPYMAIVRGLCGRKRNDAKNTGNQLKELGCTSSHLEAIRRAVYSNTTKSRFALIIEDDVFFPFDVDWNALAHSAPPGFGILQLFNSNGNTMQATWNQYIKNTKQLWVQRHAMKFFDFWSTCAYLIDRETMREVIDAVAYLSDGWLNFKIVAGINHPCVPASCCPGGVSGDRFIGVPPCTWAPRGYQADSLLYALTKTYMLTMPLITNGQGTNQSTFHQSHVGALHVRAFAQQRKFINMMLNGQVQTPSFARPACERLIVDSI